MESSVCFISEACPWLGDGGLVSRGPLLPLTTSAPEPSQLKGGAVYRNSTVSSDLHRDVVVGGLTSLTWIVLGRARLRSRVSLVPFPRGQFSELQEHLSRLQAGHQVVNVFHLLGVAVSTRQLSGTAQNMIQPWRGN